MAKDRPTLREIPVPVGLAAMLALSLIAGRGHGGDAPAGGEPGRAGPGDKTSVTRPASTEPPGLLDTGWTMRVESQLHEVGGLARHTGGGLARHTGGGLTRHTGGGLTRHADGAAGPTARTLTLFRDGVAWDFLEMPGVTADGKATGPLELVEIVLHDPARKRIVVIDPIRHVKTEVERVRLERLGVSLASWARGADDRLVRWAGGPDFDLGLSHQGDTVELVGPRVRYEVDYRPAPSVEAAEAYREFADAALLLRALLHPGGLPPFPRLEINRRIAAAGGIPREVTLEIESKLSPLPGRGQKLVCTHRVHPQLLTEDVARIEEAAGHAASSTLVDLATFVSAAAAAEPAASTATMR
jgi:hypothetical protein